jgi:tetratricopeptide (TPR) repeat protein
VERPRIESPKASERKLPVIGPEPPRTEARARPSEHRPLSEEQHERTELVAVRRRSPKVALLIAGLAGTATVLVIALLALALRDNADEAEDPLTLYQIAVELHEAGELDSALAILKRARVAAETPRAIRQIEQLQRRIEVAPLVEQAQKLADEQDYARARRALHNVLQRDPKNDKALVMLRLLPAVERDGTRAASAQEAAEPAETGAPAETGDTAEMGDPAVEPASEPSATTAEGTLYVRSRVEGTLYVDGRRRGRVPGVIKLAPGSHLVAVAWPGELAQRKRRRVALEPGQSLTVQIHPPNASTSAESTDRSSAQETRANSENPADALVTEGLEAEQAPAEVTARESRPEVTPPDAGDVSQRQQDEFPLTDNMDPWAD